MKRSLIYSDATTTRKLLEIRTSGQLAIARHKRDSSVIYKILNQEDTLIPTRALTGSLEVQIMEECTPTAKSWPIFGTWWQWGRLASMTMVIAIVYKALEEMRRLTLPTVPSLCIWRAQAITQPVAMRWSRQHLISTELHPRQSLPQRMHSMLEELGTQRVFLSDLLILTSSDYC